MKKLLPLLLFAVVTTLVSCEKHEPASITAQFTNLVETLTIESDQTVAITLSQPAGSNLTIPFELTGDGDAEEGFDYEFVGQTDYAFHIPQGGTQASLTVRHLGRNGIAESVYIKIKEGAGYALGNNYICQLVIGPRAPIYLSFTTEEIPTKEFTVVDVTVEVSGEDPNEVYEAPEDLYIPVYGISSYRDPEVTNVETWLWASNWGYDLADTIMIPAGENTGSAKMRIAFANMDAPSAYDSEYRLGVTFYNRRYLELYEGFKFRDIDTTYITVERVDPIKEFLVGKKLANPTLAFEQPFANVERFNEMMTLTGDKKELLPTNNYQATDGLSFFENISGKFNMEVSAATGSDFNLYFRNTTDATFSTYTAYEMPYMLPTYTRYGSTYYPVGAGFSVSMRVNRDFWSTSENLSWASVVFIPGAMTQTDFESPANYIDVLIPAGAYYRTVPGNASADHFFKIMENWRGTLDGRPNMLVSSSYYNMWYRFYPTLAE